MILVGCLILYHRFTLFSEMSLKSKELVTGTPSNLSS
jgi:hypothetical protein